MAENGPILCSRKRRRRRHEAKPALSAHLVLDAQLKGDVGHVSVDLFEDLFPGAGFSKGSSYNSLEFQSGLSTNHPQSQTVKSQSFDTSSSPHGPLSLQILWKMHRGQSYP